VHPEHGWQAILTALQDPGIQPYLAAGPLEDLLSHHGAAFIERVEAEAKPSARFAWLLGGVWQHKMSDVVWAHVQSVWDRRGWDGVPRVDA
jgi:hypothetical protein